MKIKPRNLKVAFAFFLFGLAYTTLAQPIGIALSTQYHTKETNGTSTIAFDIVCNNYSNDTIKQFNIIFNFENYFGSQASIDLSYFVKGITLGSVANFNNTFATQPSDSLIFATGAYLLPNHNIVAGFKINLQLNGLPDTLIAVHAKAVGLQNGKKVFDYSTNGINTDTNNDSIPNESEPTYLYFGLLEPIVPNVFTPNQDGVNDGFTIKNSTRYNTALMVYNRWGKVVYHNQNNASSWNGNYKPYSPNQENDITDTPIENGTYYFILNYNLLGQETKTKYGTITIFR